MGKPWKSLIDRVLTPYFIPRPCKRPEIKPFENLGLTEEKRQELEANVREIATRSAISFREIERVIEDIYWASNPVDYKKILDNLPIAGGRGTKTASGSTPETGAKEVSKCQK
jgi:hypothetical protein